MMKMGYPMMRRRGFTLSELMIVIAIIGILGAIAVPNVRMARKRALYARVIQDLREINAARLAWCIENGDLQCFDIPTETFVPQYLERVPTSPGCMGYEYDHTNEVLGRGETRFGSWSLNYLLTPAGKQEFMTNCF
jgi:prepilin-type N-terminal cleavage/methylation domain-containing protein